MAEYIHLIGAEDVQRAGSAMREAAKYMQQAAASIEESLFRQRQFMEEWLSRFEGALKGEGGERD